MNGSGRSVAVHVARGASYVLLQNMATNIMMIVSFSIVARLIAPSDIGVMAVLQMVVGASRVIACLGMPNSVTRFIAKSIAENDHVAAASVFYQSIETSLLLSLPVAVTIFLYSGFLSTWLLATPAKAILFQLLALDIVFTAGLLPILNSAMLGLQKIREMSTINLVYMATRQSLIVIFTLMTRSLLGLVMAWVVSELAVTLALFKYVQSNVGSATFTFGVKRLVRFSFPLFLQDAANYVYTWFDQAALLSYLSLESLGIYSAAMTAFGVLNSFAASIGTVLFPTYSAAQGKQGSRAAGGYTKGATRYLCLLVVPLSFGLFSTARPSLTLLVGEAYAEGTGPLMIISLFFAFSLTSAALVYLPIVLGEPLLSFKLTTLNITLGVVSTLVLLPLLGTTGAAIARGITMMTGLVAVMIVLRRKIHLGFDTKAFWKSIVSGGIMATVVLLVQGQYYDKYLLPMYVAFGGFTYLLALVVFRAITTEDIQLLDEYFGSRFGFIMRPLRRILEGRVQTDADHTSQSL